MNENLTDELISAYLDDELSLDERKQVEELLMDSAEHRRMFEELRALRQGLHSLPKHRLDADFARRVLHRAEREMLTGPLRETDAAPSTPPNDAAAKTATNDQSLSDEPPIVKFGATVAGASERRSLRVAIMAISAVAAALLLTFVLAPPGALEDFVPVAVHEEHVDDAAGRTDSAETAGSAEKAANQIGDIAETDAFNIAPGAAESPVDQITEDQQPAAKKFAEAEALEYADKEPMERRNAATAFDRTSPPNVGASKPADDGDHLETFKRQQQANADVTPAETAAAGSIAPGGVSTSEEIEGAKDYKYFFTVDLSQEDFAAGAMDRTLRQSGVAVYDASDKELARDKPAVSGADAKNRDESAAALALSTRQFESAKLEAAQHRGVEAFDVEATPEQIAIVLATLQAQSGQGLKAVALGQESKADAVIHFGQFAAREKFKYAQFGGLEGMRKAEGGIERLDIPQADNGFGGAGLPAAKPANVPPERTRRSIHESFDEPRGAAVPAPSAPRAKDEAGEEQRSQLGRPGAARMMRVAPAAEEDIGNLAKFLPVDDP